MPLLHRRGSRSSAIVAAASCRMLPLVASNKTTRLLFKSSSYNAVRLLFEFVGLIFLLFFWCSEEDLLFTERLVPLLHRRGSRSSAIVAAASCRMLPLVASNKTTRLLFKSSSYNAVRFLFKFVGLIFLLFFWCSEEDLNLHTLSSTGF